MKVCVNCRARFRGGSEFCPLDGGRLVAVKDPLIGRTIAGRYVVQERIGAGGMGKVYRARQEILGRDVAIKFLSEHLTHDPSYRKRFMREARAANRIHHEHIIDITDFGETDDGLVYLAMEYLDGTPLNALIAQGAVPLARTAHIGLQVARALSRAHQLSVVHRDIKPDNIYLLRGYEGDFVKLLDFGLAHIAGELRVTATGTVFGTPEYMAPEQARGAPMTSAADVYSLGCVLYEMLTGQLPFTGSTPDLVLKHMRDVPLPPSYHARMLEPEVDALLLSLLEKKAEDRPTAVELAEALAAIWERLRGSMMPPRHTAEVPKTNPPHAPAAVVGPAEEEERWSERVVRLEELLAMAHPEGDVPSGHRQAVAELKHRLGALARIRSELNQRLTLTEDSLSQVRAVRGRLGMAIEDLARDELALSKTIRQHTETVRQSEATIREVLPRLRGQWQALPPPPMSAPSAVALEHLAGVGTMAQQLLDAQHAMAEAADAIRRDEIRIDDLRFQLAQLNGRLGSAGAEQEVTHNALRGEAVSLESQLVDALADMARLSAPVVEHLVSIPELRDRVRLLSGAFST